jgi:hypothetical protein
MGICRKEFPSGEEEFRNVAENDCVVEKWEACMPAGIEEDEE